MKAFSPVFYFLIFLAVPNITFAQELEGIVNLVNKNSNLCLAVSNASILPGAETTQWNCDGVADKAWELIFMGSSVYKVQNQRSLLYLSLQSANRNNGVKVTQGVETSDSPQYLNWLFINAGNGYYKIQNLYSGLFLAVGGATLERGGEIVQWVDQGQQDILWRIVPTSSTAQPKTAGKNATPPQVKGKGKTGVGLPTRYVDFPGGGIRNNNQYVGDFCCTGETASILDNTNAVVGYVYFFGGKNPAYTTPNGAVMSDLEISLSGAKEFGNLQAPREKGSVYFPTSQVYVGSQIMTTIGRILYTVKIVDLKFEVAKGQNTGRFYMNSIKVSVMAQAAY